MSRFKVGDLVTPINMDRYTDRNSDRRKEMLGRTLVVRSVHNDEFTSVVFAGFPGEGVWQWRPDDLHLVSEAQPEPATEPTDPAPAASKKPLRRGDLVEYQGEICVVFNKGADRDGEYMIMIASLNGEPDFHYATIDELTRIGSIRKKIKRIKKEMEDGK